jgi:hypothetical protein
MQEDTGIPTVRVTMRQHHSPRTTPRTPRPQGDTKSVTRQYVDIQCNFCKAFGHKKIQCERMAQWLILQETSKQIDDKTRTKLLDNHAKLMTDRRYKQLQKVKGVVRQLYTEGHSEEADALWDHCLSNASEHHEEDDHTSASDDE